MGFGFCFILDVNGWCLFVVLMFVVLLVGVMIDGCYVVGFDFVLCAWWRVFCFGLVVCLLVTLFR